MLRKVWKCQKCGTFFYPDPPNFDCPRCNGVASPPSDYDPKIHILWTPEIQKEVQCPKCSTVMRLGYLVERNTLIQITTIGEGVYWTADEIGTIGTRIPLKAYACPECGYVETYIRRLSYNKNKILMAPKK